MWDQSAYLAGVLPDPLKCLSKLIRLDSDPKRVKKCATKLWVWWGWEALGMNSEDWIWLPTIERNLKNYKLKTKQNKIKIIK